MATVLNNNTLKTSEVTVDTNYIIFGMLKICWGHDNCGYITFPCAFSTIPSVVACSNYTEITPIESVHVHSVSGTGFYLNNIFFHQTNFGYNLAAEKAFWIAIGI